MKHKVVLIAIAAFALLALVPAQTFAQQNKNGLSITPLTFDFSLKPGESKTDTLYLTNLSTVSMDIQTDARNFLAEGEEGSVLLTKEAGAYALSTWITVSPNKITISPKEKIPFKFAINVPDNPEPGGHFGAVIFSTVTNKSELKQTGAVVSQEIGALVFIKTPGDIKEKADIESFKSDFPFYEFGPIDFTARVKNDSTIHIRQTGTITITDMLGKKEIVEIETKNILPGAIRRIPARWNKNILFGKYSASIRLTYGSKSEVLTAQTSFWAFPIRWALIALAILAVIIIINTLFILFFIRMGQRKAKAKKE